MSIYDSEQYPSSDLELEWESAEDFGEAEVYELGDAEELELAAELLEITSEEELEEFLGKLVKKVARGAGKFIKSPVGKALGGVLKNVAKTALPMVGSAIGTFVAPGVGTAIGGKLGSMASSLLEVEEYESMDEAEAELEAARRYVRWASGTVRNTARAPRGVPPRTAVRAAAVSSARRYAPALLRPTGPGRPSGYPARTSPWRARRRPVRRPVAWTTYQTAPVCTCGASQAWDGYESSDSEAWT